MKPLEERNTKLIEAVIEKAKRVCPDALALVGVYGSFATGDYYDKSDLDLLIVINDSAGWQLGCSFIQDDLEVGHDIYCTTWESLEDDASYSHPNCAKLMDAKIVYSTDQKYVLRLETLREALRERLDLPFSREDFSRAEKMLEEAEHFYTRAMIADTLDQMWQPIGNLLYYMECALAMLNKIYFRYGMRRMYSELEKMDKVPTGLGQMIDDLLLVTTVEAARTCLTLLVKEVVAVFDAVETTLVEEKAPVTAEAIKGTYEEMYSNWRNKMYLAAAQEDKHLAFMSMSSLQEMLGTIAQQVAIGHYDVLAGYKPQDLTQTAKNYDACLQAYRTEYAKASLVPKHYADLDAFIKDYLA